MQETEQLAVDEQARKTPAGAVAEAEGEARILVLAPWGHNAAVLRRLLEAAGLTCRVCADVKALLAAIDCGACAVVLTAQALSPAATLQLRAVLERQPPWSALPIVVLVEASAPEAVAAAWRSKLSERATVTVLAQPVRSFMLVSTLQAACQARRLQYEVRDLQAQLEARIHERTEQVRRLARRMARAEHQERRRIARILHDHVQQLLYGVQFLLQTLRDHIDQNQIALLDQLDAVLVDAMRTIRTLTVEMSPPVLAEEGLPETLRWLARQMQELHALQVSIEVAGDCGVADKNVRILLFQMVRELLFNVVKHAEVDQAFVALSRGDRRLSITVVDRGRGFDSSNFTSHEDTQTGFGLASIRQRLQLFGGEMRLTSAPGEGTRVQMLLPLSQP